ncbi:MAG: DNA alkylation repair protein [Veillonellales bacterium]
MEKTIRDQLFASVDGEYQKFSSTLLPGTGNVLGVRLPVLRRLARKIAQTDWRSYLAGAPSKYFEEIMLQGMVIGYAKADIEEILPYVVQFIPRIDNWSVCDSFCSGLKFTGKYRQQVWSFLQPYLASAKEYEVRFGVVMLLHFYIDEEYIGRVLQSLDRVKNDGYYAKMAVAWALSVCYIKLPEPVMAYLKNNTLDDFTYNKALQKITESYRVDQQAKEIIRRMKR